MRQESFDCPVAPIVDLLDDSPEITDSVNDVEADFGARKDTPLTHNDASLSKCPTRTVQASLSDSREPSGRSIAQAPVKRIPCMADDSFNGMEYQCSKACIDCPKCGIEADTCLEHMNLDPGGDPECFECEWKRTHGEPSNYKAPGLAFVEREQELYRSAKERLIASGVNQWTPEGAL